MTITRQTTVKVTYEITAETEAFFREAVTDLRKNLRNKSLPSDICCGDYGIGMMRAQSTHLDFVPTASRKGKK